MGFLSRIRRSKASAGEAVPDGAPSGAEPGPADPTVNPEPGAAPAAAPAPPPAPAAGPPAGPDPALEASLKRLGEQLTRMQAGMEGTRTEGKELTARLQAMEEHLRSLMALSEALTMQANPLAGAFSEAPGLHPAPLRQGRSTRPPEGGGGETPPPLRVVHPVPPAATPPAAPPEHEAAHDLPFPPPVPAALPVATDSTPRRAPAAAMPAAAPDTAPAGVPSPEEALRLPLASAPAPARGALPEGTAAVLPDLPPEPARQLAALGWLDQLAEAAGTDGARRHLAFYASIGWLGPPAHERLLALLAGLPPRQPPAKPPSALGVHTWAHEALARLRGVPEGSHDRAIRLPAAPWPLAGDARGG